MQQHLIEGESKKRPGEKVRVFIPVFDEEFEANLRDGNVGWCIGCGEEQHGVEPDAEKYRCEGCDARKVYGLEQLLLLGWIHTPAEPEPAA